jgi:hypothetical protein
MPEALYHFHDVHGGTRPARSYSSREILFAPPATRKDTMSSTPPPSEYEDIPVCTPPLVLAARRRINDHQGQPRALRAQGERGHPTPAGAIGTVVEFAGPGWALVRWDRGGQALTHPSDLTLDDSRRQHMDTSTVRHGGRPTDQPGSSPRVFSRRPRREMNREHGIFGATRAAATTGMARRRHTSNAA